MARSKRKPAEKLEVLTVERRIYFYRANIGDKDEIVEKFGGGFHIRDRPSAEEEFRRVIPVMF